MHTGPPHRMTLPISPGIPAQVRELVTSVLVRPSRRLSRGGRSTHERDLLLSALTPEVDALATVDGGSRGVEAALLFTFPPRLCNCC